MMAKYEDFKSYLQDKYQNFLAEKLLTYINCCDLRKKTEYRLENLQVRTVTCKELSDGEIDISHVVAVDIDTEIEISCGVAVDIIKAEDYDKDHKFQIDMQATLGSKLSNLKVIEVRNLYHNELKKYNELDQFFLSPFKDNKELEDLVDYFTLWFCDRGAVYDKCKYPVKFIFENMGLIYKRGELGRDCLASTYFRNSTALIYDSSKETLVQENVKPGTIVLNTENPFVSIDDDEPLIVAHEIAHWWLHKDYIKVLALLNDEKDMMTYEQEASFFDENMTAAEKAHWYAEWEASAIGMRIAMPSFIMEDQWKRAKAQYDYYMFDRPQGERVEAILSILSINFGIPVLLVKQRARQLNHDVADGAFVEVDGKEYEPLSFPNGTLGRDETFIIDENSYKNLYEGNLDFRGLIDSGRYLYIGYVVCINDLKYISAKDDEIKLTNYARDHADECCLIFRMHWKIENYNYTEKYADNETFISGLNYRKKKERKVMPFDILFEYRSSNSYPSRDLEKALTEITEIRKEIRNYDNLGEALAFLLNKYNITREQLANDIGVDPSTIGRIMRNKIKPKPQTLVKICLGLHLTAAVGHKLEELAGYKFNDSTDESSRYNELIDNANILTVEDAFPDDSE